MTTSFWKYLSNLFSGSTSKAAEKPTIPISEPGKQKPSKKSSKRKRRKKRSSKGKKTPGIHQKPNKKTRSIPPVAAEETRAVIKKKPEKRRRGKKGKPKPQYTGFPVNRHGFRILTDRDDLEKLFGLPEKNLPKETNDKLEPSQDDFSVLLERSLEMEGNIPDDPGKHNQAMDSTKYLRPEDEIDLHGCPAYQAAERTEAFVRKSTIRKLSAIRVITGKGLHSEGNPVLREVVEDVIVRMKKDGTVSTFRWEKKWKRKSGSMIVYLSGSGK